MRLPILAALLAAPLLAPEPAAAQQARQYCADNRGGFVADTEIWTANPDGSRGGQQLGNHRAMGSGQSLCVQTANPHGVFVSFYFGGDGIFGIIRPFGCTMVVRGGRAVIWGANFAPACYVE